MNEKYLIDKLIIWLIDMRVLFIFLSAD